MASPRTTSGTLALVGGQEFCDASKDLNRQLFATSGASEVLVITLAAAFENPAKLALQATDHFQELGASVRSLDAANRSDANDDDVARVVKTARFIYLSDGSAMHLRSALKDTQLFDGIVSAYRNGATLAASGAGATVLCDPMIDPRGGAYTVGFGVVEHLAAFTHYTSNDDHLWQRAVELLPHDATLVGIPASAALVLSQPATWNVVGAPVTTRRGAIQTVVPQGQITIQ